MKQILVFFCAVLFLMDSNAQSELQTHLKRHVSYLASDSLRGRATGSLEETLANDYVISKWTKCRKTKLFRWSFDVKYDSILIHSKMIACFVDNKKDSTILISAHIDHIGLGGKLSMSRKNDEIHNGADDNASGVAWLIELQKELVHKKLNYNLLFVPYTAHEIGLFGSEYLVNHLPKKARKIALVLNADMIGRQQDNPANLYVSCQDELIENIKRGSWDYKLEFIGANKLDLLDTKHFAKVGISCITISTGQHVDYHKTSDKSEYINYVGLEKLTTSWIDWIAAFARMEKK